MSSWVNYAKVLLSYYLGTQNNKYLLTQNGLKLWIVDHEYSPIAKIPSAFNGLSKAVTEYAPTAKIASAFESVSKAVSSWTGTPKN